MEQKDTLFQKSNPLLMRTTRMLMIDYDVTRYHSFDLLSYVLLRDMSFFPKLKNDYLELIDTKVELTTKIYDMQRRFPRLNIFEAFKDTELPEMQEYETRLRNMLKDQVARIVPTDVSTRFDVVFRRPGIEGFLLQYEEETNRPSCYEQLTVYKARSLFDLKTAIAIIKKHRINTIMISSAEFAVLLAKQLIEIGYKEQMSFIIGRYAYNFVMHDGECILPALNKEMGILELKYRYEFGYFDPFSGLTYQFRLKNQIMEEEDLNGQQ